jgi:hypothetical protein
VYRAAAPASMPGERPLVRVKLGRYPEVDLATARDRVRTTRGAPAKADDPAAVVLFKALATEYIERHCKKKSAGSRTSTGSMPNSARTGTTGPRA